MAIPQKELCLTMRKMDFGTLLTSVENQQFKAQQSLWNGIFTRDGTMN
jgi:hypothetical protein